MNLPNRLTLLRLVLTPLFVAALLADFPFSKTAALVLFLIAGLTDWLDGRIARGRGLETRFGQLMDPLADKILTASAFICMAARGEFPAWAAALIVSREFLITGLRLLAAGAGLVISADSLGKHKTAWQLVTILFLLLLPARAEWRGIDSLPWIPNTILHAVGTGLVATTVVLTVWSGAAYLWRNRHLIRDA